jgi:LPS sulfotransferase NodH/GT2 family glycosyltransferase
LQPRISYIICAIERTGSYLLSDALGRTGISGRPQEFFHPGNLAKLSKGADERRYSAYFRQIMVAGTTSNAVFGAKIHWSHMYDLLLQLRKLPDYHDIPTRNLLSSVFPNLRYIQITRQDKLRQAVSFFKARQTRIWWRWDTSPMQHNSNTFAQTLTFDALALDDIIQQIGAHEAAWKEYFKECGVQPFEVVYEEMVHSHEQYEQIIRQALHYLAIPIPTGLMIPEPRYRKQADETSEEWVRQYLLLKQAQQTQLQPKILPDVVGQHQAGVQSILRPEYDSLDERPGDLSPGPTAPLKVAYPDTTHKVYKQQSTPAIFLSPTAITPRPLNIVTYATRTLGGAPLRLARCIDTYTPHTARCVWPHRASDYSTDYRNTSAMAEAQLFTADVVIVFDGKIAPQHSDQLSHKELITFAYSRFGCIDVQSEREGEDGCRDSTGLDYSWVQKGLPGAVLGQIAANPYFQSAVQDREHAVTNRSDTVDRTEETVWTVVPDPLPLWEEAYKPAPKADVLTLCYISPSLFSMLSTSNTNQVGVSASASTNLFEPRFEKKILRVLERLMEQYPLRVVVFDPADLGMGPGKSAIAPTQMIFTPSSPFERQALRRQAHIILEDCVSGNYHHASLAGLSTGSVVVNGLGQQPQALELFRTCAYGCSTDDSNQDEGFVRDESGFVDIDIPFVYADMASLERVLSDLIRRGTSSLEEEGMKNRHWVEKHWNFTSQWERFWEPLIKRVVPLPVPNIKIVSSDSFLPILTTNSQVEDGSSRSVSNVLISIKPTVFTATGPARQREVEEQRVREGKQGLKQETPLVALPTELVSDSRLSTKKIPSKSTTISVVIISHNEGEYLQHTIESLQSGLSGDSEIIVVDDWSTDGSTKGLDHFERDVNVLRPDHRLGVAAARNFGAKYTKGDIIVFSDAHVVMQSNWVAPLADALTRPEVGAVAPAISVMGRSSVKGYGGYVRAEELSWHWLRWQGRVPHPVPLLCGCFLAIRRDVLEATGGFDSGMITYGLEDIEFSLRLWLLGYECLVVPTVEVEHRFRPRDKSVPDYQRDWLPVIHNMLRLAVIHFGNDRIMRLVEQKVKNHAFPLAFARVVASDAWQRRSELQAIRSFDDDWFFRKFDHAGKPQ